MGMERLPQKRAVALWFSLSGVSYVPYWVRQHGVRSWKSNLIISGLLSLKFYDFLLTTAINKDNFCFLSSWNILQCCFFLKLLILLFGILIMIRLVKINCRSLFKSLKNGLFLEINCPCVYYKLYKGELHSLLNMFANNSK